MKKSLLAMALVLLWATPAAAQAPEPTAEPAGAGATAPATPAPAAAKKTGERNRGIMASLSFGVNGCTDDWCDNVDPMVFLRLHGLFRIFKYFAAGMHISMNFFNPDVDGADTARYWQLHLAPEFRGIFPWKKLDFWTALTIGYVREMSYVEGGGAEYRAWVHGLGIGWGIGAQYFVMSMLAVGVDFWLYKAIFTRGCGDDPFGGGEVCDDISADDRDDMNVGITWAIGLTATFYWGM